MMALKADQIKKSTLGNWESMAVEVRPSSYQVGKAIRSCYLLHKYFTYVVIIRNINIAILINGKSLRRNELSCLPRSVRCMKTFSHNTRKSGHSERRYLTNNDIIDVSCIDIPM